MINGLTLLEVNARIKLINEYWDSFKEAQNYTLTDDVIILLKTTKGERVGNRTPSNKYALLLTVD